MESCPDPRQSMSSQVVYMGFSLRQAAETGANQTEGLSSSESIFTQFATQRMEATMLHLMSV